MTLTTMFNYSLSDGILRQNPEASDTFMFLNTEGIDDVLKSEINFVHWFFVAIYPEVLARISICKAFAADTLDL